MTAPGLSTTEYHAMMSASMSEIKLQNAVTGFAQRLGFLVYHTHDSRRSQAGYPDLHLVHPARKLSMFRELKTGKGKLTEAQLVWQDALAAAGADVGVWRPIDWFNNTIRKQLSAYESSPS